MTEQNRITNPDYSFGRSSGYLIYVTKVCINYWQGRQECPISQLKYSSDAISFHFQHQLFQELRLNVSIIIKATMTSVISRIQRYECL